MLENDPLAAFWMPFTANRAYKATPRQLVAAKDMHYTASDGRQVLDGTAESIPLESRSVHARRLPRRLPRLPRHSISHRRSSWGIRRRSSSRRALRR